jgi:hypothetical protein
LSVNRKIILGGLTMAVDSATEKIGEHYFVTDSSTNGHA